MSESAKYRSQVAKLCSKQDLFLADGGLETFLIFKKNIDLPCFASFALLESPDSLPVIQDYFKDFVQLANDHKVGMFLDTPTWRLNWDYVVQLNLTEKFEHLICKSVNMIENIRNDMETADAKIVLNASLGPRGDAYVDQKGKMTAEQAFEYHDKHISVFVEKTPVDCLSVFTLNYVEEAIGINLSKSLFLFLLSWSLSIVGLVFFLTSVSAASMDFNTFICCAFSILTDFSNF